MLCLFINWLDIVVMVSCDSLSCRVKSAVELYDVSYCSFIQSLCGQSFRYFQFFFHTVFLIAKALSCSEFILKVILN